MLALGLILSAGYSLIALLAAMKALADRHWADVLDPGRDAVAGLVGLGLLIVIWRKYGWITLREKASVKGYALARAIEDWKNAELDARRLAEKAQKADKKPESERLAREADRANARAQESWKAVGAAMRSLHAAFPEDALLAKDLEDLFPEKPGFDETSQ